MPSTTSYGLTLLATKSFSWLSPESKTCPQHPSHKNDRQARDYDASASIGSASWVGEIFGQRPIYVGIGKTPFCIALRLYQGQFIMIGIILVIDMHMPMGSLRPRTGMNKNGLQCDIGVSNCLLYLTNYFTLLMWNPTINLLDFSSFEWRFGYVRILNSYVLTHQYIIILSLCDL